MLDICCERIEMVRWASVERLVDEQYGGHHD
jgi:hypothetical protein